MSENDAHQLPDLPIEPAEVFTEEDLLGVDLDEVVDIKTPKQPRFPKSLSTLQSKLTRRMNTGQRINRKKNNCPSCKRPNIEVIDQKYLWGVDSQTLARENDIDHKELSNHFWRHKLPSRRFAHPMELYQAFIEQADFGKASPDARLALAMKAIDRLNMLGVGKKSKEVHRSDDELMRLLGMSSQEIPEWKGDTGVTENPSLDEGDPDSQGKNPAEFTDATGEFSEGELESTEEREP